MHKAQDLDPLKPIIDVLGALVVLLDRSGRVVAFNRACERLTGYSEAEIVGRKIWDLLLLPEERASVIDIFQGLKAGDFPNQFENYWVTKDGGTRLITWSNTALLDEHGDVQTIVGTGIDVTEGRRAEQALRKRDAILEAVTFASEEFLKTTDWEHSIQQVIQRLARAAGATHAYLIQFIRGSATPLSFRIHDSWTELGSAGKDLSQLGDDLVKTFEPWGEVFKEGRPIVGLVKDLPEAQQAYLRSLFKSMAIVPIFLDAELWGVMGFAHNDLEDAWQVNEVDALRAAAGTFGAALQRRKSVEVRLAQERFLSILADITRMSMQIPDIDTMLQTLADRIVDIIGADDCFITLWNAQNQSSVPIAASAAQRQEFRATGRRPGAESATGATLRAGKTLVVENLYETDYVDDLTAKRFKACSGIGLPLLAGSEPIGVLFMTFRQPHQFTEEEVARCEQATQQVALIIAKAQLLESEQAARQRAETLRTATEALSSSIHLQDVLDTIMSELQRVVPYDSASVQEIQGSNSVIIACRGFPNQDRILDMRFDLTSEATPNRLVIQSKKPLILADAPSVYSGFALAPHAPSDIHAWLGVPLMIGGQVIGMISLDKHAPGFYTQDHQDLALAFAAQAAIAIQNARLFAETQRRALEQETLNAIIAAAATAPDLPSLVATAMDRILATTGLKQGGIWAAGHYHRVGIPPDLLTAIAVNKGQMQTQAPLTLAIEDWAAPDVPAIVSWLAKPVLSAGIRASFYTPVMAASSQIGGLVLCCGQPRRWSSEEMLLFQSVAQQIGAVAQRLQLTQEVRLQQEQVLAQERLAALGRMAAGIAHDFNNILQGITGFADIVARQPRLDDATQRRLERIQEEGRRGADLVRQILDFSRQSPPNLQPVDLEGFLLHLVDLWHGTLPPTIELITKLQTGTCLVRVDQSQLSHVFTNLFVNASESMPNGGQLSVSLHELEIALGSPRPFASMAEGRWLAVSICDTGCGIAASDLPRVFEPFFTTKRTGRSAGLGLARAYGIVQQHAGYISLDSQPGAGTAVTVYLPAIDPALG